MVLGRGGGRVDILFVASQLVEKTREHDESLYMLFVDQRKAYDSVPRQALWKVWCATKNAKRCEVISLRDGC